MKIGKFLCSQPEIKFRRLLMTNNLRSLSFNSSPPPLSCLPPKWKSGPRLLPGPPSHARGQIRYGPRTGASTQLSTRRRLCRERELSSWRRAQTSQTSLPSQPATRVPFFDTSMLGVLKDFCPSYASANPLLRTFLACCTADSDTDDNLFLSESYKQFFCPNTQYR